MVNFLEFKKLEGYNVLKYLSSSLKLLKLTYFKKGENVSFEN
jgi:hypothetical protein